MRPSPASEVVGWIGRQPASQVFITAITEAEIRYGIALLPAGKRREIIGKAAAAIFAEDFAQRVLPFGSEAAPIFAQVAASRRVAGRPISQADAQIAAIAQLHRATLATRNVEDFAGCGIGLANPWRAK